MDVELGNPRKMSFSRNIYQGSKTHVAKFKKKVIEMLTSVKKLGEDDPRRIIHSFKVGLALTVVSLLYFYRPLYNGFGVSAMWAVLTVVVVFEFTVGGTLSKGLNRGFATLLAGSLGVGVHYLADLAGKEGEPLILGLSVFFLAAAATFSRFFPGIKAKYDYGVLIFILTFSLVTVSSYRVDELIELAHQRLSTVAIGVAACIFISLFICPVWAGQDLHNSIANNMEKLASFLEGFPSAYFCDGEEEIPKKDVYPVERENKSFLKLYKTVLNSKASEDTLANFARWEPGHGCFKFRHPWQKYLKIGALNRQCAYFIEALNTCMDSEIQASCDFRNKIQCPCQKMSLESSKALKELATSIKTMTRSSSTDTHICAAFLAAAELKTCLKTAFSADVHVNIVPVATVTSLLVEIVKCTEKIAESVNELAIHADFKDGKKAINSEKPIL